MICNVNSDASMQTVTRNATGTMAIPEASAVTSTLKFHTKKPIENTILNARPSGLSALTRYFSESMQPGPSRTMEYFDAVVTYLLQTNARYGAMLVFSVCVSVDKNLRSKIACITRTMLSAMQCTMRTLSVYLCSQCRQVSTQAGH